ncbi:MBL fold metallo-hydrolase [Fusibacter sp. JL298sf-3]
MKIVHLNHSSVLVETRTHQLFFDVTTDVRELLDHSKTVCFFVSHHHGDHFSSSIYDYSVRDLHYVISDDVEVLPSTHLTLVKRDETYKIGALTVATYGSTDEGVAFVVEVEGRCVLHMGDLNWWHWQSSTPESQAANEKEFKTIVDAMPKGVYDVAFVPLDYRLETAYDWSVNYVLETKNVKHLIPIHLWGHFESCNRFLTDNGADERFVTVYKNGQVIEV